jgi:hypothetical protein
MLKGFERSLSCKTIEGPDQHDVKLAPAGVIEQLPKALPINTGAAFMVNVLSGDGPVLRLRKLPHFYKLVLGLLPSVDTRA